MSNTDAPKESKPKISRSRKLKAFSELLSISYSGPMPNFHLNLAIVEERGDRNHLTYLLFDDKTQTCDIISEDYIKRELNQYLQRYIHLLYIDGQPVDFLPADINEAFLMWACREPKFPDHPKRLALSDDVVSVGDADCFNYAYHRAPFSRINIINRAKDYRQQLIHEGLDCFPSKLCPAWVPFRDNMSNFEAFLAWVWSLFEEGSDISQYLYLYGKGQDGKSVLASAVGLLIGSSYLTATQVDIENRFFLPNIVGKRLCYVSEASPKFPTSGKFRALTGERNILCEMKGKQHFQTTHNCKFLFSSNHKVQLTHSIADMRRVIYCEFQSFTGKRVHSEKVIKDLYCQFEHLLPYCKAQYDLLCDITIKTNTKEVLELADKAMESAAGFFERYFEESPHSQTRSSFIASKFRDEGLKNSQAQAEYKDAWERLYKVKDAVRRFNGKNTRVYLGMRPRNHQNFLSEWSLIEKDEIQDPGLPM